MWHRTQLAVPCYPGILAPAPWRRALRGSRHVPWPPAGPGTCSGQHQSTVRDSASNRLQPQGLAACAGPIDELIMIELSPPEVLLFPSLSRTAVDPVDALIHRHDAETCTALGASAQNRELDVRASGSRVEARQRSADRKSPAGVDVVMISAPATIPDAMGPVRFGASGRLSQPVQIRQLSELVDGAPQRPRLSAEETDIGVVALVEGVPL